MFTLQYLDTFLESEPKEYDALVSTIEFSEQLLVTLLKTADLKFKPIILEYVALAQEALKDMEKL